MIDEIVKKTEPKMKAALNALIDDLKKVRTGRANPAILDSINVTYYGVTTPLREVASISVPESTVIAIKPWDRNALGDIELAIRNSDLGFSPVNDGIMIRLVLPPMTEERRREIAGNIKKMAEQTKVVLRNVRGEAWERVQEGQKKGEVTEDDRYRAQEELNQLINNFNKQADKMAADKETEIMKI